MFDKKLKRILVPIEGAATDEEGVSLACALAKRDRSEVLLLYVIEVKRNLPIDAELSQELEHGEQVLDRLTRHADKLGCRVESDLLQAREAGAAIVNEAVERGSDLIVMGVPYHEEFGEYVVEPRAQFVLENALCRVVLTREPLAQGQKQSSAR